MHPEIPFGANGNYLQLRFNRKNDVVMRCAVINVCRYNDKNAHTCKYIFFYFFHFFVYVVISKQLVDK